jgi:NAD(P)-dependent dehydrogenase (short-subunit alcohol dehydrogenase family)
MDKVVLITGASSGIGAALARELGPQGAKLVLGARRVERLNELAAEIQQSFPSTPAPLVQRCDVGIAADVEALFAAAETRFGRVDVAVANAGYGLNAKVHETSEEQMRDIWQTNLMGTWYVMMHAARVMIPRRSGHIMVVSSVVARRSLPETGAYAMTKAAQLSLVQSQRVELAAHGIYVSSVHPASTETDFFKEASRRSGHPVGMIGQSQTAQAVARKMVRRMQRPRPELWPAAGSWLGLWMASALPSLTDRALARKSKG